MYIIILLLHLHIHHIHQYITSLREDSGSEEFDVTFMYHQHIQMKALSAQRPSLASISGSFTLSAVWLNNSVCGKICTCNVKVESNGIEPRSRSC